MQALRNSGNTSNPAATKNAVEEIGDAVQP